MLKKGLLSFFCLVVFLGLVAFKTSAAPVDVPPGLITSALYRPVCTVGNQTLPRCHALVKTDKGGGPVASALPSGYGPAQFRGAYNLTGITQTKRTIAIIDAFDVPSALTDLNFYSKTFGIPTMNSCPVSAGTASSPCFQKVDQNGGTKYPTVNAGWALETSLDVQTAHAICQNCNILLVEANGSTYADLMTALDTAKLMGADVISNSYGSNEFSGETGLDSHFLGSAIITFSSGDAGYGPTYPAASQYVVAVGGTTLTMSGNNYVSETVWNGAGSGCSAYEPKPSWQGDTGCTSRTIADISADADPNTGAAVYDSVRYQGRKGWFQVGGTSLASPIIAGVYALSGNLSLGTMYNAALSSNLRDITVGSNGSCSGSYLCTAVTGYDGPTGMGTPKGTGAF